MTYLHIALLNTVFDYVERFNPRVPMDIIRLDV